MNDSHLSNEFRNLLEEKKHSFSSAEWDVVNQYIAETEKKYTDAEKYKQIFNKLPFGVRIQDSTNTIRDINEKYSTYVGIPTDLASGRSCKDFVCPVFCKEGNCAFETILHTRKGLSEIFKVENERGEETHLLYKAVPIIQSNGIIEEVFESFIDITDYVKIEREFSEQESLHKNILEAISDAVFITDKNLKFTFVCPNSDHIFKETPEEIFDRVYITSLFKDIDKAVMQMKNGNEITNLEYFINDKYDTGHFLLINIKHVDIARGKYLFTCRDITDKKKAEYKSLENEQKLTAFISQSPDAVTIIDNRGKIIEWNSATEVITGFNKKEVLGKYIWDIQYKVALDESTAIKTYEKLRTDTLAALNDPNHIWFSQILEMPMKSKTGEVRTVQNSLFPIDTSRGQYIGSIIRDITPQKVAESKLIESENKFRRYIESSPVAIFIADSQMKFKFFNQSAMELLDYSRDQLQKLSIIDVVPEDLKTYSISKFMSLDHLEEVSFDFALKRSDNSRIEVRINSIKIASDEYMAFCTDITHIKKIEEELRKHQIILNELYKQKSEEASERKEELNKTYKVANEGIWEWDVQDNIAKFSPTYYTMLEYTPYEFDQSLEEWEKRVHPDDLQKMKQKISQAIDQKTNGFMGEFRMLDKKNQYRWIRGKGVPYEFNNDGKLTKLIGTHTDVHFEKLVNIALLESEFKYKNLVEQINEWIWEINEDLEYVYCSPKVTDLLGYSLEEVIGKTPFDLMDQNEAVAIKKQFMEIWKSKESFTSFVNKNIHKDGHIVYLETSGVPIFDESNNIIGYRGTDRDISQRFLTDEILKQSEENFRNIFNSALDAIIITNPIGKMIDSNMATVSLLGIVTKNEAEIDYFDFFGEDGFTQAQEYFDILGEKGTSQFEILVNHNGVQRFLEISGKSIQFDGENAFLHIARDITQKKEFERILFSTILETEEKERKRFAKDIHDGLGPQLSAIKLYVNAITNNIYSEEQRTLMVDNARDVIDKAIESTREIANNIMPSILSNFGFIEAIKTFCNNLNKTKAINATLDYSAYKGKISSSYELVLYRVINELINNSIKHAKASFIFIKVTGENDRIRITYVDDGIGFDVDKVLNNNVGNGINNIISRIKSIEGKISFSSKQKEGILVKIFLN